MTDLERAARAEAERVYALPGSSPEPTSEEHAFIHGASWLAEHLLSDESVERGVQAVLWHRWHMATGVCACGEHFIHEEEFAGHAFRAALEAALGGEA